jgi:hypothetical protein
MTRIYPMLEGVVRPSCRCVVRGGTVAAILPCLQMDMDDCHMAFLRCVTPPATYPYSTIPKRVPR